jgi:hypothetical protein
VQGEKQPAQSVPKRGDEGDFSPLVDINDGKSTKQQQGFGVAISETDSYDSDGKNNTGYSARAYR